ncbi:hypothetical protein EJ05DRAFT_496113 [Pseudovirgaria hyperparasitica]|uniref:Uncharacterized protein n=1 Tax=Pseudovirgaria hyperparasitica TaxID=470096 RepID=A0A6A6WM45_9PEZI|nr:uncharacterized protein EJ05DRAFT_496113 [Pseudovirgaria hyperparasitica]KAF2763287.1 hypothetical protein EJ05DRAFT_496113 [Pseudovirgaria hyperparasitica]
MVFGLMPLVSARCACRVVGDPERGNLIETLSAALDQWRWHLLEYGPKELTVLLDVRMATRPWHAGSEDCGLCNGYLLLRFKDLQVCLLATRRNMYKYMSSFETHVLLPSLIKTANYRLWFVVRSSPS